MGTRCVPQNRAILLICGTTSPTTSPLLLPHPSPAAFATAVDVTVPFSSVAGYLRCGFLSWFIFFSQSAAATAATSGTAEKLTGHLRSWAHLRMGSCNICKCVNKCGHSPSPSSSKNGRPVFSLPSRSVDCDLGTWNIQVTTPTSSQQLKFLSNSGEPITWMSEGATGICPTAHYLPLLTERNPPVNQVS